MGADLSRLEKRADEADRYVEAFLKCVYLRDRVGQTFEGLITTVVEFGCFVQLLGIGVDGLLHLTALRDDDYVMTRDGGQWQGRRSGRRFAPGMRVRVRSRRSIRSRASWTWSWRLTDGDGADLRPAHRAYPAGAQLRSACCASTCNRGASDQRASAIEAQARAAGLPVERVDAARLRAWVGEVAHQGVVADVEAARTLRRRSIPGAAGRAAPDPLVLALDGVQDPHNLGACLRTADACGVLAVLVPRDRAASLNATARKVAAGAAETTPVVTRDQPRPQPQAHQGRGPVDCRGGRHRSAARGRGGPYGRALPGPGAEGSGLRELTRRSCDWLVSLPSLGSVESLNVSVATGMLLYEALRQRHPAAPRG